MRILITGGAGFIGSHLVKRLFLLGHDVSVVDDLSRGSLDNLPSGLKGVEIADISSHRLIRHLTDKPFDIIYHLACHPRSQSLRNPQRDVEVNVLGSVNILEIARRHDSRIVYSSNSGIYAITEETITEDTPDSPQTPYDLNKLWVEKYIQLYHETFGLEAVVFRFATVYGPHQTATEEWKPVVIEFIDKLSRGIPPTIYWDGEQTRDFIYVGDIVDALVTAMDSRVSVNPIILATGVETSINELYRVVSDVLGVNIPPKRGPPMPGDMRRMSIYSCSKAKKLLNWNPSTPLREGIEETVKWRMKHSV